MNLDLNIFDYSVAEYEDNAANFNSAKAFGLQDLEASDTKLNLEVYPDETKIKVLTNICIPTKTVTGGASDTEFCAFKNTTTFYLKNASVQDKVNIAECVIAHFGRIAQVIGLKTISLNKNKTAFAIIIPSLAKAILLVESCLE